MFFDLTKLGNQFNEVIQKAKDEVEKSVDNALGIDPTTGSAQPQAPAVEASRSRRQSAGTSSKQGKLTPQAPAEVVQGDPSVLTDQKEPSSVPGGAATPSGSLTQGAGGTPGALPRKVVKKLVATKKVVEKRPQGSAATAPGAVSLAASTASQQSADDCTRTEQTDAEDVPAAHGYSDAVSGFPCSESNTSIKQTSSEDQFGEVARREDSLTICNDETGATNGSLSTLNSKELYARILELQEQVGSRDTVLLKQADQISALNELLGQLQEKNEQLALRAASINEEEFESHRSEFEQRLATAERKVYALTKERDALKKGAEKITEYSSLLKEKDGIIKQVMEEGEKLSKKQIDLEGIIKKLRAQVKEYDTDKEKLQAKLTAEESSTETLRKAKAKLERDLQEALDHHKGELEQQKEHYEGLFQKARADQLDAEERAREVAKEGLVRKLKEAETRNEALAETVVELREALDRQRQAADLREEMLKQDIADLERRCHAAELRHQDLTSKFPDATRPLLRQIEAMQAAAAAQADAWAGAEQTLNQRITETEGKAAAAVEKERMMSERLQSLQSKQAATEAALNAARGEVKHLHELLERESLKHAEDKNQLCAVTQQLEALQERCNLLQRQYDQLEKLRQDELAVERQARTQLEVDAATVQKEFERRITELLAKQAELQAQNRSHDMNRAEPPAMAAPGYRWALIREDEEREHAAGNNSTSAAPATLQRQTSGVSDIPRAASSNGNELYTSGVNGVTYTSDVEYLKSTLRQKQVEQQTMEQHMRELELTRDRLAEELVKATQRSEQTNEIASQLELVRKEMEDLQRRYVAAVEMLGEKDEELEELRADIIDMKQLYKEQVEFMMLQVSSARLQERTE